LDIDASRLLYLQNDAFAHEPLESPGRNFHPIVAARQQRNRVVAAGVGVRGLISGLHGHPAHSDAAIRIPSLVNRARKLGIGVAVTDHNEIQGAVEAATRAPDLPVIPGIELNSLETVFKL